MKKCLLLILLIMSLNLSADENKINLSKVQLYNLGIKVGVLKKVESIPLLNVSAKVVIPPDKEYIVSTSQAGLVSKLNKTVGDNVKKGELIAQLKSPELLALQQQYLRAASERRLTWAIYQRDKKLSDEGIIADKRLQESRSRHNSANVEVNAAMLLLNIAGMSVKDIKKLSKSQRLSSELNIYAPMTGVILDRMAVAGQRLDMLAPLYRIANLKQLLLEIHIPQEQVGMVRVGDKVSIDNSMVQAHISLLTESVDIKNQSVLVRAIIEDKDSQLRVGQNVNARIEHGSKQTAFEVPNVAIAQSEGQAYIFVRTKRGFLVQPVKIINKQEKYSVITGDLKGSEEIALRAAVALKANWLGLGSEE